MCHYPFSDAYLVGYEQFAIIEISTLTEIDK